MNTASLRQKLLAQRAAIREEAERREETHEKAKDATKILALLGYNFEDIVDLATPKVSENYLLDMFRSVGYTGKRKRLSQKSVPFGAPRWLDVRNNMIISSDSDSEDDPGHVFSTARAPLKSPIKPIVTSDKLLPQPSAELSRPLNNGPSATECRATNLFEETNIPVSQSYFMSLPPTKMSSENAFPKQNDIVPIIENNRPDEPQVNGEPEASIVPASDVIDLSKSESTGSNQNSVVDFNSSSDGGSNSNVSENDVDTMSIETESSEVIDLTHNHSNESERLTNPEEMDFDKEAAKSTRPAKNILGESRNSEVLFNKNVLEEVTDEAAGLKENINTDLSKVGTSGDKTDYIQVLSPECALRDEGMRDDRFQIESISHSKSEDHIREQTERVKAQIEEIRNRKLRLTEQRRNVKLREIATKKLKLIQARQSLDMGKATAEVARLENKLMVAKAHMIYTAQKLKVVEAESEELEKEELRIREEGKSNTFGYGQEIIKIKEKDGLNIGKECKEEIGENKAIYTPLTVESSPLRMFSSFRMCPSLSSRYWFAPTFNSRFVKDLEDRVMCETELKRGACRNKDCRDVHFYEFEVPGTVVCQYMASREIDDPGFRAGLIDAVETHLKSEEAPVGNLAATIIGYRRKRHSTQFLDWGASAKPF